MSHVSGLNTITIYFQFEHIGILLSSSGCERPPPVLQRGISQPQRDANLNEMILYFLFYYYMRELQKLPPLLFKPKLRHWFE